MALANIFDPVTIFFLLGLLAALLKGDIRLPEPIYQIISIYLMLAIGLKGGVALSASQGQGVVLPVAATLGLGILLPLITFWLCRLIGKLTVEDSAAMAAHYGSVSAVTFAVTLAFLDLSGVQFEGFVSLLLVVMEVPAIVVGILLARWFAVGTKIHWGPLMHELLLNRSVYLLMGGLVVGFYAGPNQIEPLRPVFFDAFKGVLAFFLLEMGVLTAQRLGEFRKAGWFIAGFALIMPLIGGFLGSLFGLWAGLSVGGCTVLAAMSASASYIAAPAAVRVSIPQANPTYYLTASLGITFPFNVVFGIPIYYAMSKFLHAL
jgi:hypothetical protein